MKTLFCFFLLSAHSLFAQDLKWNAGSIVLSSGAVVTGKIHLARGQNLILFQQHPSEDPRQDLDQKPDVAALPAHLLKAVYFYDETSNINRRFIAIGERTTFPGVQLYEVVVQGRIDVLRRPRDPGSAAAEARDFDYFCSDRHKLIPLWKFYREMYPSLNDALRQQVAAFVKANGLQRTNTANVISIIGYCNKLARSGEPLARQ